MTLIHTPESAAFLRLSYDETTQQLTVTFRDQISYQYSGVPNELFALLASSPSRGRYFNLEIRRRYPGRPVSHPPEQID
jgi:hypothetical protein